MPISQCLSAVNRIKAVAATVVDNVKSVVASVSGKRPVSRKNVKVDKPPLTAEELEQEKAYYKEMIDNLPPPRKNAAKAIELMHRLDVVKFDSIKATYDPENADGFFHK